jgi:hypothetical protein
MNSKEDLDRSGRRENSPKGSPADSLKRRMVRSGVPEAHLKGGPRHRDGRPARAEGQHPAGAAKQRPGGPRKG